MRRAIFVFLIIWRACSRTVTKPLESSTIRGYLMRTVRIILLGCLAAVWIVACSQDTVEDPVDSPNNLDEDEEHYHHGSVVIAL